MKILPFIALFSVLIFTSSYVSSKIDAPAETTKAGSFRQFVVHPQGTDVALSWSVSLTEVEEFAIERSYDGISFEAIGSMRCKGAVKHQYRDVDVKPGTLYYRVSAIKANQSVESSATQAVQIYKRD